MKRLISVVTPCYNEAGNVEEVYRQVKAVFEALPDYDYEHIFADNASKDQTLEILKGIARDDRRVKIIVNSRNFGAVRSQYHSLLQARGAAAIYLAADLQDPPALIPAFLQQWEQGYRVVMAVKETSEESWVMFSIRRLFYSLINLLSDAEVGLVKNSTGFGLYDQCILQALRQMDDHYPYLRGMVPEIGYDIAQVVYQQPVRKRGKSSQNLYTNYDLAMVGITNHSKLPLRLATFGGALLAVLWGAIGLGCLVAKIWFLPTLPLLKVLAIVGLFLLASVQLFCIGILGEYVGAIHTQVLKRPLVIERERINFEE